MNRFIKAILIGMLLLAGCGTQSKSALPFVSEDPSTMQFLVRQYHGQKNYTDFKEVQKEYKLEEGNPDDYYLEYEQRVKFGYEAITQLQNLLKNAEVTETDEKPNDTDLFYMVKLNDCTLYYFYSTGHLKTIAGDAKTIYKVNSEEYQSYITSLHDQLAEVQWYY